MTVAKGRVDGIKRVKVFSGAELFIKLLSVYAGNFIKTTCVREPAGIGRLQLVLLMRGSRFKGRREVSQIRNFGLRAQTLPRRYQLKI